LHATREQQQAVADAVDKLAREGLDAPGKKSWASRSGTDLARPADDAH
jgi:hypothetical protein